MRSRHHTTTLSDAWGEDHEYACESFGFDEGVKLGLTLSKILAGPLGEAIDAASLNADQLMESRLDLGKLGQAVAKVPESILQAGGTELFRRILSRTKRSRMNQATGERSWDKLNNLALLDAAYAENYAEAFKAVWWVLECNYGPFSMASTGGFSGLLGKLASLLPGSVPGIDAETSLPGQPRKATASG